MDREMPVTAVLRDLNKLNTFVRVAQCQSFTKAAAELRTRPSVVSKRMNSSSVPGGRPARRGSTTAQFGTGYEAWICVGPPNSQFSRFPSPF